MEEHDSISNSEWKVMKTLWCHGEASLPEILDDLKETRWSKTTIQTYLTRLVKKGIVGTKKKGRGYIYTPLINETDCQMKKSRKFLDTVFDGSLSNMVFNMMKMGGISAEELDELKLIMEREEEEENG